MADIDLHRPHSLGLAAARQAVEEVANQLYQEFELEYMWDGDELHFERTGVRGMLAVTDSDIAIKVQLGLLFKAFKGAFESEIRRNLDEVLEKTATRLAAEKQNGAQA